MDQDESPQPMSRQQTLFEVQPLEEDICANRHGGAETSIIADKRVQKDKDRQLSLRQIQMAGPAGMTLDELSVRLDRGANRISGRLTELRKDGKITATDRTRLTRTRSPARVYTATTNGVFNVSQPREDPPHD